VCSDSQFIKMRLSICLCFILIFLAQLDARRDSRSSSSRSSSSSSRSSSSSSRSSSSSSSRSSSWGGGRSSSSYPKQSFGGSRSSGSSVSSSSSTPKKSIGSKIKEKLGFGRKSSGSTSSSSSSGSSYPKQSWGAGSSSSYPKQQVTNTGGGSPSNYPKQHVTNTGAGSYVPPQQTNVGQPPRTNYNQALGAGGAGVVAGGVAGGIGGGHVGGGGFIAPKPVQNNGYSNQAPPSSSGGFVNPSPAGTGGYGNTNYVQNTRTNYNQAPAGTGGYGNSNYGQPASTNYNQALGAGVAGGMAGGFAGRGQNFGSNNNYRQNTNFGSYSSGQQSYGARVPGYGTNWGTNFAGGVGQYGQSGKTGYSKKALGLGVGAGFLGGAAVGVAGTMATYSAMHKYQKFKNMMHERNQYHHGSSMDRDDDWNHGYIRRDDYYQNYYLKDECYEGCPQNSVCRYSFCECNYGYEKKWGQCQSQWGQSAQEQFRPSSFDPFKSCNSAGECQQMDMNLICNKDLTTQGTTGKCECRPDMKWNTDALECQMYLDADCSKFTYDTPPSPAIQEAVERAKNDRLGVIGEAGITSDVEKPEDTINKSLLKYLDPNTTPDDVLLEAYCRDIDAYSFDLNKEHLEAPNIENRQANVYAQQPPTTTGVPQYEDPNRPANCEQIPVGDCASGHDSKDCLNSWTLEIKEGKMQFKWKSLYFAYRNKIELVGVRPGCTFTGYGGKNFDGDKISIKNEGEYNRWVALGEVEEYKALNNNIESVECVCGQ